MTLFEAKPYDPARERRRTQLIIGLIVLAVILAGIGWRFRHFRAEHQVDKFFDALEAKDFEKAYGIWMNDPSWKQHPEKHAQYPFHEFYVDWGPGGEWGVIKSHKIEGSAAPKNSSGLVVVVTVNDRSEKARIWVEGTDHTLTFSPY